MLVAAVLTRQEFIQGRVKPSWGAAGEGGALCCGVSHALTARSCRMLPRGSGVCSC